MNLISLKGGPKVFSLVELLKEWLVFRKNTVTRKLEHRLDQVNDRLHIVEGLLIVYLDLDTVIKIIRESDEPKPEPENNEQYYFPPPQPYYEPYPQQSAQPTQKEDIFTNLDKTAYIIIFASFILGFFMGKTMQPVILRPG